MKLAVVWMVWLACCLCGGPIAQGQTTLYSTGFEFAEDYLPELTLTGQNGWMGTAADGVVTNFFEGLGQQAYIGFAPPPDDTNDVHSVFQPVNLEPVASNQALVTFSVLMQVADSSSTNGPWDDFRWSVYNTNEERLFSLDFDNASLLISYILDDDVFVSAELSFDNQGAYDLVVTMDFARNLWSATLNDELIVQDKPITTRGRFLTLGDIDAVWVIRDPARPGDNYMLFDDYTITAQSAQPIRPRLEPLGFRSSGSYQARLFGQPGSVVRVEASSDLVQWATLLTFTVPPGGMLEFQDSAAQQFDRRFDRARQAE
jgi:hypothetical protein